MTEPQQFMSREVFAQNWPDIAAQVNAMLASPKSRKRFRLLAVYERGSGELLAELLRTSIGPVIVYRSVRTEGLFLNGEASHQRRGGRRIVPLTGDPAQYFQLKSSCAASYDISGRLLLAGLNGDRSDPDERLVFR